MLGVGVRTTARSLIEVVSKDFATGRIWLHTLRSAPVTHRSGTLIRGEHAPQGGNKRFKKVLFLSAFAVLSHPP
ncbi:transposase [Kocuria flava]|uniref:transposase n=1 Tax=Kocuria flava TaxID=446860 RepID=UPI0035586E4A